MITEYTRFCLLCGKPTTDTHHLIFGGAWRKLADEDKLCIPLCRDCHSEIHMNGTASKLSKILGQVVYEYQSKVSKEDMLSTREEFRKRYGKSYL